MKTGNRIPFAIRGPRFMAWDTAGYRNAGGALGVLRFQSRKAGEHAVFVPSLRSGPSYSRAEPLPEPPPPLSRWPEYIGRCFRERWGEYADPIETEFWDGRRWGAGIPLREVEKDVFCHPNGNRENCEVIDFRRFPPTCRKLKLFRADACSECDGGAG